MRRTEILTDWGRPAHRLAELVLTNIDCGKADTRRCCYACQTPAIDVITAHSMMQMSQTRRALVWAAMALIVVALCVLGFRGYLSTEMLLNFANAFYC